MAERGGVRSGAGRKKNTFSPSEINNIRARIKGNAIVRRLNRVAMGEEEATSQQVTAALGLLKKIVPDLSSIELSSDPESPLKLLTRIELVGVSPAASDS